MQRSGHPSARNLYLARGWIKYRILQGGMPRRQAADHQPPVHCAKDLIRGDSCFVHATESSDCQSSKECRGQTFSRDIAEIQADRAVGEFEVVQKIAAYRRNRLKLVGNGHTARAQRFRRQHHALERARLFQFLITQFFECLQLGSRSKRVHSLIQGRGTTPRRGISGERSLAKKPASQWKKSSVVSSRTRSSLKSCNQDGAARKFTYERSRHNSARCCACVWHLSFLFQENAYHG